MSERAAGWFHISNGSGSIEFEGGPDIFFCHATFNTSGIQPPSESLRIGFEIVGGVKGPAVNHVTTVQS
jgi:cold shock CspA family protein